MIKLIEAIKTRRSVNFFESYEISDEEIYKIIELANLSPSSMNLQPWKVIVVKTLDMKKKLKEACFNQIKVVEASCDFVIVADPMCLEENIDKVLESWVQLGYLKQDLVENYKKNAFNLYKTPLSIERKVFAVKNSSFFAMSLMYAAMALGFSTHPMDGFNEAKVRQLLDLPETVIIPVIIACGKVRKDIKLLPRAYRRSVKDFIKVI